MKSIIEFVSVGAASAAAGTLQFNAIVAVSSDDRVRKEGCLLIVWL